MPKTNNLLFIAILLVQLSLVTNIWAQNQASDNAKKQKRQQKPTVFWPSDVEYDRAITTPREHFGFDIGQRHLRHDQIVSYLKLLADQSDRITLEQYGRTHGKRPLLLATITSPENHLKVESIQADHRNLADPKKAAEIDTSALPVVMNMGYCVHGDEPSAGNCAPLVAYYLAAAQGAEIEKTLDSIVVLLDPTLNPDGFDRFARWANAYRGRVLNSDPAHAEHNQGWPAGRVNYYWFDLNRDWLPLVHPESQSRMNWYHAWKPNVVLDFHEMGTNSTYFFQPGVPRRTNPLTPQSNIDLTTQIAEFHARAFDRRKELYFTQEVFDDFYMGKGSTYPDLHGAIGILFEQASSRGHLQENDNGLLSFPKTIQNQFTASRSSLEAASLLREKLHDHKVSFYREAFERAKEDPAKVHLFVAKGNQTRLHRFAELLTRHDIDCFLLSKNIEVEGQQFDKRFTLAVPSEQREYLFLQSLIEKRKEFAENIFYDVSAWTIPLAYNLEHYEISESISAEQLERFKRRKNSPSELAFSDQDVAYLIDWRDDKAPRWLHRFLDKGLTVKVATRPVIVSTGDSEKTFGYGSLLVSMGIDSNKPALVRRLLGGAAKDGLSIFPVQGGLTVSEGVDLGSNYFRTIEKPEVGLFVGGGTSFYDAGEIWHALDTRVSMPLTLIKKTSRRPVSLDRYNRLVMVRGSYDSTDSIKSWVQRGGTLIAFGSAADVAASLIDDHDEVNESGQEEKPDSENAEDGVAEEKQPIQKPFASARNEQALKLVSGAIFRASIDPTHPLFYGYENKTLPVFRNHARVLERSVSSYANPLVYDLENPLWAGYSSKENQEKLAGTAGVVIHRVGSGRIILFADNMNFRGFWLGTQRAFLNALFFGELGDPPNESARNE